MAKPMGPRFAEVVVAVIVIAAAVGLVIGIATLGFVVMTK